MPTGLRLDLYHLDSAYVAWRAGLNEPATFDLYTRSHPFAGGYLLVAGLEPALSFVRDFGYSDDDIEYLRATKGYHDAFLNELAQTRFTGEILAMPEGTIAFADEPLLRVTGPFREALLLESGLLHDVNLSTLVATKAARVVTAAAGRPVAEFGLRRAHAPFPAARAAWIGGCASTSFVEAAKRLDIPATGTIPHALVQAFDTEEDAFRAVAEALPEFTLLLDTYDVERAIHVAVEVGRDAAQRGHVLRAVRLDSGDMASQARLCRKILDDAGLTEVEIFASGDLDEFRIAELLEDDPPIDALGVGTSIGVGAGSAERGVEGGSLTCVYKLAWAGRHAAIKQAGAKSTWPGRKQVWRVGDFDHDLIALDDEAPPPGAHPLLEPVSPQDDAAPLDEARERAREQLDALPDAVRRNVSPDVYRVEHSTALGELRRTTLRAQGLA
jgi:nicotinate phosphoribosyltransferase